MSIKILNTAHDLYQGIDSGPTLCRFMIVDDITKLPVSGEAPTMSIFANIDLSGKWFNGVVFGNTKAQFGCQEYDHINFPGIYTAGPGSLVLPFQSYDYEVKIVFVYENTGTYADIATETVTLKMPPK